jgi:hypothetical protein
MGNRDLRDSMLCIKRPLARWLARYGCAMHSVKRNYSSGLPSNVQRRQSLNTWDHAMSPTKIRGVNSHHGPKPEELGGGGGLKRWLRSRGRDSGFLCPA